MIRIHRDQMAAFAAATGGGARAACPEGGFTVRLEHRSRYTATTRYSDREWVSADRFYFLVGQARVLSVRVAEPEGAVARWEITPIGAHSGTIPASTGSGNRFDYTPVVTEAERPITASRSANPAVSYQIKAVVTYKGSTQEKVEIVKQDERDIIRQEFVDFRTWRSGFTLHVPYRNRLIKPSRPELVGNYSLVLDSHMTELLDATEKNLGAKVHVSSPWRNPRRNLAAGSKVPNSNHQHGGAVDMQPVGFEKGNRGTVAWRKGLLAVYNAARAVGAARIAIVEHNSEQLYPSKQPFAQPSAEHPDRDGDGLPDDVIHDGRTLTALFNYATHTHIDRDPPDEREDD